MRTSRRVPGTASRTPLKVATAGAAILTLALVWVVPPALAQESGKPKQGAEPAKKPASLYLAVQEVSDPLTIDSGQKDFVTVIKAAPTLDTEGDMIVQAILNVRNDGDVPVTVTYRGVLDGDHVHPLTFNVTVPPGAWDLSTVQIQCNSIRPGQHTIELQALVAEGQSTVTFADRLMTIIEFRPIWNPPG